MKSKVLALTAMVATTQLISLGCAKKSEGTSSTLTTSVVMTSSSAAATVAKTSIDKFLSLFMPQATALPVPSTVDASGANTVNITSAWIAMKEIEFKAAETLAEEGAEDAGNEIKFRGPYYIDLLSNAPSPLDTQELPAKIYRRIKMKLEASGALIPAGTPAELASNSIYVTGTVNGSAFTYLADDGTEFEISGPNGVNPEDGQIMLISLKLANVIKLIDMSLAGGQTISSSNRVAGANLCPLIDASASDLYTCFRIGLEQQADFGKDSDGSGELEADEDNCDNL